MANPVLAHHLILSGYGFWLPNDPRGSWSQFVRSWELFRRGGAATTVTTHRSLAGRAHDGALRQRVKQALARPAVVFTGDQARAVARGFAAFTDTSGLVVHACAILPDHAHLVIARHRYAIEQVANLLKGAATRRLIEEGLHPFATMPGRGGRLPSPWARKEWSVFLFDRREIERAVRYVERNPVKAGLRPQRWRFVTPVDGRGGGA
jgi:REP element-mobilizing transposase RayT